MTQEPDGGSLSRRSLLASGAAGAAALSGCLTRGESSDLSGEIKIDGSDTVFPHSAALAEEFQWRNNKVRIPVSGSGTGAGFKRFCADETHLQNASREITDDEEEACGAAGVEYVELEIVLDGIAVFVNPANEWCDCLTVEELGRMWESGSDVETWADVRPDADWPDEEIELFGRDTASGTFDYFTENVTGERGNVRSDYSATSDTNVIVRGVRGDEHAIGFGGAGYYYENEDELKLLGVDDGNGCSKPTRESVENEEYQPLSRMMYTYVKRSELAREEVQAFTHFYFETLEDEEVLERAVENGYVEPDEELSWTQWAARKVGYYGIPDETVAESREKLEAAIEEVTG